MMTRTASSSREIIKDDSLKNNSMGILSRLFNRKPSPLEILIERYDYGLDYTEGRVYIDGALFGESMEPFSRHLTSDMSLEEIKKIKVAGKTAIPTGRYKVILAVSNRLKDRSYAKKYNGRFPLLVDVPGFSGILEHPLNKGTESAGCIGLGEKWKPGVVLNSQKAHFDLMDFYMLPAEKAKREVYITIVEK